jgi:hypothetical protein
MKKNCYNCTYLEWIDAEANDPSGFICHKRDYRSSKEEDEHLKKLENNSYLERSKKCSEVDND